MQNAEYDRRMQSTDVLLILCVRLRSSLSQREDLTAIVHVRRPDRNAQADRLGHVDRRVVEAAVVGQAGTEEFGGPVRFQIGGAVADIGVGGGMALVEAVAGKRHTCSQSVSA